MAYVARAKAKINHAHLYSPSGVRDTIERAGHWSFKADGMGTAADG